MALSLDQFTTKWKNRKADWDNAYSGQCVDLFRYYCDEVLIIPQPAGVWGAANLWTNFDSDPVLKRYFTKIPNTMSGVPQKGDVIIWDFDTGGGYGHVGIFIEGNAMSFKSFDQNWRRIDLCEITTHNYNNVYGWLRPKTTPPGGEPTMPYQVFHTKFTEAFRKHKDTLPWGDDKHKFEAEWQNDPAMIGRMIDSIYRDYKNKLDDIVNRNAEIDRLNKIIKDLSVVVTPKPELPVSYNGKEVLGVIIKP